MTTVGFERLKDEVALIAEVLSYIIEDTKDLAEIRLVSKAWNQTVVPHCLKSKSFLKICGSSKYSYIRELVQIGESSYAGRRYEPSEVDIFKFLVRSETDQAEGSDSFLDTTDILLVKDRSWGYSSEFYMEKQDIYSFLKDCAEEFNHFATILFNTKSWDDFQRVAADAESKGFFFSVEDLEKAKSQGVEIDTSPEGGRRTFLPLLLRVRVPEEQFAEVSTNESATKIALLKAKVPKKHVTEGLYPLVYFLDHPAIAKEGDDTFVYPTFVGYNPVDNHDGTWNCLVPMALLEDDEIIDFLWEWETTSFLPLSYMWSKCQEQPVREGVAIADGFVPERLHKKLIHEIDLLVNSQIVDYHPHSNEIVRDIVHPALYSYVKGVSPLLVSEEELAAALSEDPNVDEDSRVPSDYWGRKYEESAKYQWLPTYFEISEDGSCKICDYINNLVPRAEHEALYRSLSQLFSQALPLIESVYAYCRVVKEGGHIRYESDDEISYDDESLEQLEEMPVSLRGKQVQVVTKIVDYELGPGETYSGVWHVEGMSHEEIVATAIYFIGRDDEIEGGDILFKRAFYKKEAQFIFSSVEQIRPTEMEEVISEGLQPIGQAKTLPGRLLVFPNSHVHKVTELKNVSSSGEKKKRRIIVFFLINPEQRIVSTREVAVQQEHAGGTMKREEAMEHRLALMKERKFAKQDWNVREIELCEH